MILINGSVSGLNEALNNVEKDLSKQLETFNKTITQTKIFEQKVNEQLILEKKRFELERPEVTVVALLENKDDVNGKKYGVHFQFFNIGKRTAKNFNYNAIIGIIKNKRDLVGHQKMGGNDKSLDIIPQQNKTFRINIRNSKPIDAEGIEEDLRLIILLKYSYKDEYLNQTFKGENYFVWYGFKHSGLTLFNISNNIITNRLDTYIDANGLNF